jgi:short-subunit dehydrogenase
MKRELQRRRILITGASSGIGRCLAKQLAAEGGRVAVAARSVDKLEELVQSAAGGDGDILAVPADITVEADRQRMLDTVVEHFGGLDVLVNNAGVGSWGHFGDSNEDVLRQIMEVNFFAAAELIRLAIPLLTEGNQPAVVNIASMCGRRAMPAWSEYSASKFALCGLTEALRGEMARFDIDMLLIVPGLTRSGLSQHLLRKSGRANIQFQDGMPPEQVAQAIVKALRKNRTETVIGRDARWMLRVNRFLPRLVDRLLARRVRKLYASQRERTDLASRGR